VRGCGISGHSVIKLSKQNFLQLRYFSYAFYVSTCRSSHNHINTMRFALSNSVHSMLIQPFLHPRTVLILFYTNIFPQCEPEVSLLHTTKYILNDTVNQVVKKTLSFIKPKAHCRFQTSMPPDLYLSQNNPADKITHSYCFTIKSDKNLPSTATYTKWYHSCRFYEQRSVCFSSLRSEWHSLPTSTSSTYLPNNNFVKSTNN
jgi:hypothetical protein